VYDTGPLWRPARVQPHRQVPISEENDFAGSLAPDEFELIQFAQSAVSKNRAKRDSFWYGVSREILKT